MECRQATGVKVGDVLQTSAIIWVRRTLKPARNSEGQRFRERATKNDPIDLDTATLEGAAPGDAGQVRVRYGTAEAKPEVTTEWMDLSADYDHTHQFFLTGLKPATKYYFAVDTAPFEGKPLDEPLTGSFTTPPEANERIPVTFTVISCIGYQSLDHDDGFNIYPAMQKLKPQFIVPTGDSIYLDSDAPRARTVDLARYHWQRMASLPRHVEFHRWVPGYWEKDDHDTYCNDCYPGGDFAYMLPLTFDEGLRIANEQVPIGGSWYRTVRWGKALQIWLLEVREFHSPNHMPDGPEKSIWGAEQKKWLKETLAASDADWRIIVTPGSIVGPDRPNKADNLANHAFDHEGNEIREWIQKNGRGNIFLCGGDRHWQYHSVHPTTGVVEFGCGAGSDEHASGSPGEDPAYHKFHRVKGGFLSVTVVPQGDKSTITFRHHDVHGAVVHEFTPPA